MLVAAPFVAIFGKRVERFGEVHIAPYFEKTVGVAPRRWKSEVGCAIARHCKRLDQIAADGGATPLSGLGLDDDLVGKGPVWRDPEEGLKSVTVLEEALHRDPAEFEDSELIISDLESLKSGLSRAASSGARFCLVLLHSGDPRVTPCGVKGIAGSFT